MLKLRIKEDTLKEKALDKICQDREAIKLLLEHSIYINSIHLDDEGNPYWESCGEPLIKGTKLVFKE